MFDEILYDQVAYRAGSSGRVESRVGIEKVVGQQQYHHHQQQQKAVGLLHSGMKVEKDGQNLEMKDCSMESGHFIRKVQKAKF